MANLSGFYSSRYHNSDSTVSPLETAQASVIGKQKASSLLTMIQGTKLTCCFHLMGKNQRQTAIHEVSVFLEKGKKKKNPQFFLKAYQARTGISELMEQVLSGELVRPERSNSVQLSSEIFRAFLLLLFFRKCESLSNNTTYTHLQIPNIWLLIPL